MRSRRQSNAAFFNYNRGYTSLHETGNHADAPCDLQGQRCVTQGGERNGPARNSSGAVPTDSWKRGADGVKKLQCLSNYWSGASQSTTSSTVLQTSLAAALISRWTALLSHAAMHAFAASLLAQDCSNHTVEESQPSLTQVLAEAPRHATNPSRLPALLGSRGNVETDQ